MASPIIQNHSTEILKPILRDWALSLLYERGVWYLWSIGPLLVSAKVKSLFTNAHQGGAIKTRSKIEWDEVGG